MEHTHRFALRWRIHVIIFMIGIVVNFVVLGLFDTYVLPSPDSISFCVIALVSSVCAACTVHLILPRSLVINDEGFSVERTAFSVDSFPFSRLSNPGVRQNVRLVKLVGGTGEVLTFDFYKGVAKTRIQLAPSIFKNDDEIRELIAARVRSDNAARS